MEKAVNKLEQWFSAERDILNNLAHDVAQAESVDEMMRAKTSYEVQSAKVDAILEAVVLVKGTK